MRRCIKLLLFVVILLFLEEHAFAQRSGSGTFSGPNMCGDVVGQISQQTYCIDQTSGSLNVWNGSAYQLLSGTGAGFSSNTNVNTLITNTNTGSAAQGSYLLQNDTGHRGGLSMDSSGWATPVGTPVPPTYVQKPDQLLVTTNAVNGIANIATNPTVYTPPLGYSPFTWSAQLYQGGIQNFAGLTSQGGVDSQAVAFSVANPQPGKGSYAAVYVSNDSGAPGGSHYLVQQIESSNNTDNGPPDSALIQTSASNGLYVYSLSGQVTLSGTPTLTEQVGGTSIGQYSATGLNILTGSLFKGGKNMFNTGTWTPSFGCTGGNPSIGGAGPSGTWIATGNLVFFTGVSYWSTASGGSGGSFIGGLPGNNLWGESGQGGTHVWATVTNGNITRGRLLATVMQGENFIRFYDSPVAGDYLVPWTCANTWANTPSGFFVNGYYQYQ